MTHFDELAQYGLPREHIARFTVAGVDYEVLFTQVTRVNPYDCVVVFPVGFILPQYGNHYDVSFDTRLNRINKTYFQRATELPVGAGSRVFKSVVKVMTDHYTAFNVALYTFSPADARLASAYCRFVSSKRSTGTTIEVGLEPGGKANVLRTPKFYGQACALSCSRD